MIGGNNILVIDEGYVFRGKFLLNNSTKIKIGKNHI